MLPPLGSADHNSVLLAPVYNPVIQRVQRVVKTVKDWTEDSVVCLQGCFDCTDWEMFDQMCTSFNELTDVISSYISLSVESVIPSKHITIFPNNKPWVTTDLKGVLNKKKRVFFQGATDEKKQVNREVRGAIRKAKEKYRQKIESKFSGGCLRAAWQGIKNMAAVNKVSAPRGSRVILEGVADEALPNHMNTSSLVSKHDFSSHISDVKQSLMPEDSAVIDQERLLGLFKHTGVNKYPGPDGICGRILRSCSDQLSGVFQRLLQTSIDTCTIPDIWKLSTVILIPKKDNPKLPNDFRPIALTSVVMKTLKEIIKFLILAVTECNLDPLQFAYRSGRSVDDAKLFILNTLYRHLEGPQTHARILFAGFSSTFNTIQPHILANKLVSHFSLDNHLVLWIFDFLTNRLLS